MGKLGTQSGQISSNGRAEETLDVVKPQPLNAEALESSLAHAVTPPGAHFVRTHFRTPRPPADAPVSVEGAVATPMRVTVEELRKLGLHSVPVTLECAGNGRLGMAPLPSGEPWKKRAVSTAVWGGVPLRRLLERALVRDDVCEVLIEGWDQGEPKPGAGTQSFARSLPLGKALEEDTLLAFEMNGEDIPARHGGPVRLVVPGWYGVASVKWVRRLVALPTPYRGYFQGERYVYVDADGRELGPVAEMKVKSLLVRPTEGESVPRGEVRVAGWAWSGSGIITKVEVNLDGAETWSNAQLEETSSPHMWRRFEQTFTVDAPGRHTVRVRATDEAGNMQPHTADWNQLGYGNNAIEVREFHVH